MSREGKGERGIHVYVQILYLCVNVHVHVQYVCTVHVIDVEMYYLNGHTLLCGVCEL